MASKIFAAWACAFIFAAIATIFLNGFYYAIVLSFTPGWTMLPGIMQLCSDMAIPSSVADGHPPRIFKTLSSRMSVVIFWTASMEADLRIAASTCQRWVPGSREITEEIWMLQGATQNVSASTLALDSGWIKLHDDTLHHMQDALIRLLESPTIWDHFPPLYTLYEYTFGLWFPAHFKPYSPATIVAEFASATTREMDTFAALDHWPHLQAALKVHDMATNNAAVTAESLWSDPNNFDEDFCFEQMNSKICNAYQLARIRGPRSTVSSFSHAISRIYNCNKFDILFLKHYEEVVRKMTHEAHAKKIEIERQASQDRQIWFESARSFFGRSNKARPMNRVEAQQMVKEFARMVRSGVEIGNPVCPRLSLRTGIGCVGSLFECYKED